MEVFYKKRFLKQLAKLPRQVRIEIETFAFENLPNEENIESTGKIEKLKGYTGFYKARFGSYRVGLRTGDNDSICVETVMHRSKIYQVFP